MSRRFIPIAGALALVALIAGIGQLFLLRFRVGDVYPPYSTFRADPLGARVLYESLAAVPGLAVERNVRPIERLGSGRDTALLFLGDTVSRLPSADLLAASTVSSLNRFLRSGGRIVITLQPRGKAGDWEDAEENTTNRLENPVASGQGRQAVATNSADLVSATNSAARPKPGVLPEKEVSASGVSLTNWLDVSFAGIPGSGIATATVTAAGRDAGLPEQLACHTALCFTNVGGPWRVLYRCGGQPVIVERSFGQGSFALSTLSYVISNEALRDERQTGFLVWLLAGRTHIVFDETHHGIEESPGLMTLVRRYGLTWALVNLLVLAGLFIWRNNTALIPAEEADLADEAEEAVGKDSATALGNLLRRNVAPDDLLATCVAVWKRSADHGTRLPATTIRRIEATIQAECLLPERQRSPEMLYNEICRTVKEEGGKVIGH